jgi:hypothetical protein
MRDGQVTANSVRAAACHYLDHVDMSLEALSHGGNDLARAAHLAAEEPAVATRGGDRWTGGNNPRQPVNLSLRVSPSHDGEMPVAKITNRRHTSREVACQRLADHGLDLLR